MAKIYMLITIDTENPQISLTKGIYKTDTILNSGGKENYGLLRILKVLKDYDAKATFFLDVYEKYYMGEKLICKVSDLISNGGHDIQLHTHPVWKYDPVKRKKVFMNQYNYYEQIEIINRGIEDLQKLTGKKPIAHRAGGFGINNDTIKALYKNNIKIDSSVGRGHIKNKNYCLSNYTNNVICRKNDILELPISSFGIKSKNNLCFNKIITKDLNINACSLTEIQWFYGSLLKQNVHYINIILHSFSFYKFCGPMIQNKRVSFNPDLQTLNKFIKMMEFFKSKNNVNFVTMSEFYKILNNNRHILDEKDFFPIRKE